MLKFLKIIALVGIISTIIYYGGASLLPDKQYFTEQTVVAMDPVAAYDKLISTSHINTSKNKDKSKHLLLSVSDTSQYYEIHYKITFPDQEKKLNSGYFLKPVKNGTELLWYLELDSLSYPQGRWEGFLAPVLYRTKIRERFKKLEENLL